MKNIWKFLLKPQAWISKLLIILLAIAFFAFGFLDYLRPVQQVLDAEPFAFQLGDFKFSVYLMLKAFLTIIILFWLAGLLADFAEARVKVIKGMKSSNKALIIKTIQIVVYFLAFLVGLDVVGIDLTTLAVFSGAVGIGLGFGLQKVTSNFISGIILLFEKSIEVGDLVELSDGIYGFIKNTGARHTLVETFEGKEIMVPNEDFITNRVTNWTYSNTRGRVEISIGVSYDSDIAKARDLIIEAAKEHPKCIEDPEPVCFLREFADSSVNFLLFFWVADVTEGRYGPQSDVMFSIWSKFKEHNIAIPYPQRDIHIKSIDKKSLEALK